MEYPMDQSTSSMLETIDKRISKLQQIRAMIVEEFGQQLNSAHAPKLHFKRAVKRGKRPETGRKQQIHEWLKANGPASRSEIIEGSGLPEGTVGGYLSAAKDLFENRDGKWHAR